VAPRFAQRPGEAAPDRLPALIRSAGLDRLCRRRAAGLARSSYGLPPDPSAKEAATHSLVSPGASSALPRGSGPFQVLTAHVGSVACAKLALDLAQRPARPPAAVLALLLEHSCLALNPKRTNQELATACRALIHCLLELYTSGTVPDATLFLQFLEHGMTAGIRKKFVMPVGAWSTVGHEPSSLAVAISSPCASLGCRSCQAPTSRASRCFGAVPWWTWPCKPKMPKTQLCAPCAI
jgi:hypothetical protein